VRAKRPNAQPRARKRPRRGQGRGQGRVAVGITPHSSHRSGRAQLTHPVCQRSVRNAPFNLREASCTPLKLTRGVTGTRFGASMCSPWFPPRDPPVGSALPSTGSSGASSPASWVLWRCATPWLPFAALRCLRLAIPDAASVLSLPAVPNDQPRARGSSPVPSTGIIPSGDAQGLPGSQGTLLDLCRVLRPRPDRTHLADDGVPMLPPFCPRRRLPRVVLSRLNRTALALAVYASSSPLRCRRRKTRFRWLARPCRVGLVTHRVPTEGFRDHPSIPSSFPELSWRKDSVLFASLGAAWAGDSESWE